MLPTFWQPIFAIVATVSLIPVTYGVYHIYKWRSIVKTPTNNISEIEPGLVEVSGEIFAFPGTELISPMRKLRCVRYHSKIFHLKKTGGIEETEIVHETVWEERGTSRLLIKDDTGWVRVDAKDPEIPTVVVAQGMLNPGYALLQDGYNSPIEEYDPPQYIRDFIDADESRMRKVFSSLGRPLYFEEKITPTNVDVFLRGDAEWKEIEPELSSMPSVSPFRITKKMNFIMTLESERKLIKRLRRKGLVSTIIGSITMVSSFTCLIWSLL